MFDYKILKFNLLLFAFNLKKFHTSNPIYLFGEDAVDVHTFQIWFARFRNGYLDLNDKENTGRPNKANENLLEELLEEDPKRS
jgi:transposase